MKGNRNQQKRHGRSLHARLFSLLLAAVTAVTMILMRRNRKKTK